MQNDFLFVLFIDFYASKCTFIWTTHIKSILAGKVIVKYHIKMHWTGDSSIFEREVAVDTGWIWVRVSELSLQPAFGQCPSQVWLSLNRCRLNLKWKSPSDRLHIHMCHQSPFITKTQPTEKTTKKTVAVYSLFSEMLET